MTAPLPRRLLAWLWERRVALAFLLLMAALLPARGLWAPDEPDFAQAVREMRERGTWLLPWLNGQPYAEKPILFFWVAKAACVAGEALTGGHGFEHGIAAWALRLPSVAAAVAFALAFRAWAWRFQPGEGAELACLVLFTTPLWVWQAQTIQTDMLFAALLAWAWLAWSGGYVLASGPEPDRPGARRWLLGSYAALGLAVLTKGPLALVLSALVGLAFLVWQRDLRALGRLHLGAGLALLALVVAPWYAAVWSTAGPAHFHQLVVHQNLNRATQAWDHIQPWWRYLQYLAGDFWPWVLLLPALAPALAREHRELAPLRRFQVVAFLVPLLFLSWVQSKQGKYLLMVYPFLALLLGRALADRQRNRDLGWILAGALALMALASAAVAFAGAGGARLQEQVRPFLGPLRLGALLLLGGAAVAALRARGGLARPLVRDTALALGLVYLTVGTWGFRLLDDTKGYRRWTEAVQPLIEGRRVYFWQTLRSGAMVYTGHRMPELRSLAELEATLGPEDRLVSQGREWVQDAWGMTPAARRRYEVLLRVRTGGNELLLIRRRPGD